MKRRLVSLLLCVVLIATVMIVPTTAQAAGSKMVKILKVTVDGARIRQGPGSKYEVVTSVKKGSKVFYLGKTSNSFCYVRTSNGVVGYMYRGFLKSYGAVPLSQVYYCSAKKVTVYKRSGNGLKKTGTLYKNQHVIVYEVRGKWAYIKSLSGKSGYVRTSALKKAS